jgi:hypothetical protein
MAPKRTAVGENRYAPYEAKMDANNITYRYVALVPLTDVSRYADTQARLRIAGTSTVNTYAEKMRQGEVFPPIILWEDGRDGYCLLDGNTRDMAMRKLGRTHTDAYIVSGLEDDNHAIYVSSLFNTINGVSLAKDEILRAIRAGKALTNPMSDARLAKDLGVPASRISRLTSIERFNERADQLGLATEVPEDTKIALAPVVDDSVLRELHTLVLDADLKGKDIRPIVRDVSVKGSEAERLKVVTEERVALAPTIQSVAAGRTTTAPPSKDSLMAFGRIHALMGKFSDVSLFVPVRQDTRDEWYPKIQAIHDFIGELVTAYENAGVTTDIGVAS